MKDTDKLGLWVMINTMFVIVTMGLLTSIIENKIETRQQIEKRAYKRMTPENKKLIEYIIFGENQE